MPGAGPGQKSDGVLRKLVTRVAALFRTDPVGGYPPGTPDMPAQFSRAGTAHNLAACYGWRS